MTSPRVQARRERLWDYVTSRPHEKMTLAEVAYALGCQPGHGFGADMAAVRHWADESGVQITNCWYDDEAQCAVFTYLPQGEEDYTSVKPLRTQSRQIRTRLRNLGGRSKYVADNAVRADDRAYGRLNQRVGGAVSDIFGAIEAFEYERHDDEGDGPRAGAH